MRTLILRICRNWNNRMIVCLLYRIIVAYSYRMSREQKQRGECVLDDPGKTQIRIVIVSNETTFVFYSIHSRTHPFS